MPVLPVGGSPLQGARYCAGTFPQHHLCHRCSHSHYFLDYRSLYKLKHTYLDQLPTYVHSHSGRIHSSFNQTATATGRLSSENPNLQNIPVRTAEGRRVRRAFVPSAPERVLLSADYSQIELRVVAHYSKDPTFLAAYREGLDIHALTASAVFGVAESKVTREMRSAAKEINFGLIYRMGADRLALVTHTPKAEAKAFIERFFQKYATIHALQERFLDQARQQGFAQTLLGRRRYLPEIDLDEPLPPKLLQEMEVTTDDFKEAFKWHQKAAEQGNSVAQLSLGTMYSKGEGVPENDVTAYAWLNIAQANGAKYSKAANDTLAKLKATMAKVKKMTPEQITEAEGLAKEMIKSNPKLIQKKE